MGSMAEDLCEILAEPSMVAEAWKLPFPDVTTQQLVFSAKVPAAR